MLEFTGIRYNFLGGRFSLSDGYQSGITDNYPARDQIVHFVCFQEPPESYKWILPTTPRYFFYDVFTDPFGWNVHSHSPHRICNVEDNFLQLISSNPSSEESENVKLIVVFDGLSTLTRQKGIHHVCQLINSFVMPVNNVKVSQFIAIVENELLSELELNSLKYIAHSYIQLTSRGTELKHHNKATDYHLKYNVDVVVKKTTGRVIREVGSYYFTDSCKLRKSEDVISSELEDDSVKDQSDPMANLTFNLKLTDQEKAVRSQVRLPYVLDEERKASQLDKASGVGRIIYEPDDADDFDEEDPDDDLDI